MAETAQQKSALRPVQVFRAHFEDESILPVDISACDPDEVRRQLKHTHPGKPINKVKIVRGES